jgi:hypothetical protein
VAAPVEFAGPRANINARAVVTRDVYGHIDKTEKGATVAGETPLHLAALHARLARHAHS